MVILSNYLTLKRINAFEEIKIMEATTSYHMLNIMQNNNHFCKIPQPLRDQTVTSTDSC
jgi:hypothetical protein